MILGVAVDMGVALTEALKLSRGANALQDDALTFKRCVVRHLGADASTVLVDAEVGPALLSDFPPGCERMMAFEADAYRIVEPDRITVLPDNLRVEDFPGLGVSQLKFLMFYAPDDAPALNDKKQRMVAEMGAMCRRHGLRFLMEPLAYHPELKPGTAEFALRKPDLVAAASAVFADPGFGIDILKVEPPVDLNFVEGFGDPLMSRDEAVAAFRNAAAPVSRQELVYLSAGVTFERFLSTLELATEAGVDCAGFMCGRALWADAIEVYGQEGEDGLNVWMSTFGRSRLRSLIAALRPSREIKQFNNEKHN